MFSDAINQYKVNLVPTVIYIDKNGKILSEEWFNYGFDFKDGLALVERINGESCKIDKTGKIVVRK